MLRVIQRIIWKLALRHVLTVGTQQELNAVKIQLGENQISLNNHLKTTRKHLWEYEVKVFSQWGEDGIISFLLHRLGIVKPNVLEIGAGNFTECNSRFIVESFHANAYLVDGRDDLVSSVFNSGLLWKSALFAESVFVTRGNASEIWARAYQSLGAVDLVSLDLDGNDYWILKELPLGSASVVVCEYNPLFGSQFELTIPYSENFDRSKAHFSNLYYGMSLRAAIHVMGEKGFTFMGSNVVGNNAFFVRNDLVHRIELPIPIQNDLSIYSNWKIRESRDESGKLTYLGLREGIELIQSCSLIDLSKGQLVTISDLKI